MPPPKRTGCSPCQHSKTWPPCESDWTAERHLFRKWARWTISQLKLQFTNCVLQLSLCTDHYQNWATPVTKLAQTDGVGLCPSSISTVRRLCWWHGPVRGAEEAATHRQLVSDVFGPDVFISYHAGDLLRRPFQLLQGLHTNAHLIKLRPLQMPLPFSTVRLTIFPPHDGATATHTEQSSDLTLNPDLFPRTSDTPNDSLYRCPETAASTQSSFRTLHECARKHLIQC